MRNIAQDGTSWAHSGRCRPLDALKRAGGRLGAFGAGREWARLVGLAGVEGLQAGRGAGECLPGRVGHRGVEGLGLGECGGGGDQSRTVAGAVVIGSSVSRSGMRGEGGDEEVSDGHGSL